MLLDEIEVSYIVHFKSYLFLEIFHCRFKHNIDLRYNDIFQRNFSRDVRVVPLEKKVTLISFFIYPQKIREINHLKYLLKFLRCAFQSKFKYYLKNILYIINENITVF